MATLDERKIEEIVAKVLERLGGGGVTSAPARGPAPEPSKPKANIPRGTNGVYADPDQAATAARKAFEQNEKTPVATRLKMVEAMRKAVLANNDALSRYAVEEIRARPLRGQAREESAGRGEDARPRDPPPAGVHR